MAPVLHFYQPPTQFPAVLKRVWQESYRPLIDLLGQFTRTRATVNINGALTEMLLDSGHDEVIDGLKRLADGGRIELLGSAMYHPILPLLPEREIRRQIALNHSTNRRAFGDAYRAVADDVVAKDDGETGFFRSPVDDPHRPRRGTGDTGGEGPAMTAFGHGAKEGGAVGQLRREEPRRPVG